MARKDELLRSFMKHNLIKEKYEIPENELPFTIKEGKLSEYRIIRTISMIIDEKERNETNTNIFKKITSFLNNTPT